MLKILFKNPASGSQMSEDVRKLCYFAINQNLPLRYMT